MGRLEDDCLDIPEIIIKQKYKESQLGNYMRTSFSYGRQDKDSVSDVDI